MQIHTLNGSEAIKFLKEGGESGPQGGDPGRRSMGPTQAACSSAMNRSKAANESAGLRPGENFKCDPNHTKFLRHLNRYAEIGCALPKPPDVHQTSRGQTCKFADHVHGRALAGAPKGAC